jgi:hypothetical protein
MENIVQTSGWVGKNNRGKKRRSDNGRLHSFIVCAAKALHRSEKCSRNLVDKKRQLGKKELLSYCNHVDFTIESIEWDLKDRMTDYSQRSSEIDRQANLDALKKELKQPCKITEAQRLNKVDKSDHALGKATLYF